MIFIYNTDNTNYHELKAEFRNIVISTDMASILKNRRSADDILVLHSQIDTDYEADIQSHRWNAIFGYMGVRTELSVTRFSDLVGLKSLLNLKLNADLYQKKYKYLTELCSSNLTDADVEYLREIAVEFEPIIREIYRRDKPSPKLGAKIITVLDKSRFGTEYLATLCEKICLKYRNTRDSKVLFINLSLDDGRFIDIFESNVSNARVFDSYMGIFDLIKFNMSLYNGIRCYSDNIHYIYSGRKDLSKNTKGCVDIANFLERVKELSVEYTNIILVISDYIPFEFIKSVLANSDELIAISECTKGCVHDLFEFDRFLGIERYKDLQIISISDYRYTGIRNFQKQGGFSSKQIIAQFKAIFTRKYKGHIKVGAIFSNYKINKYFRRVLEKL